MGHGTAAVGSSGSYLPRPGVRALVGDPGSPVCVAYGPQRAVRVRCGDRLLESFLGEARRNPGPDVSDGSEPRGGAVALSHRRWSCDVPVGESTLPGGAQPL